MPFHVMEDHIQIIEDDCLHTMRSLMSPESVDAIVTDPPYGLSFMGRDWDHGVPGEHFWREALRVAKPGAHLVAFGGTRTFHRLTCAIEDAGWEVRDCLGWLYGSGFPKSLDVSKAIDKAAGVEPIDLGASPNWRESKRDREKNGSMEVRGENAGRITAPATEAAQRWQGWGTALKPAWEPIILARKPLTGTVAANVQRYGTGALNIDGCRIETDEDRRRNARGGDNGINGEATFRIRERHADEQPLTAGRWPANIVHDGSDEVLAVFPQTSSGKAVVGTGGCGESIFMPNSTVASCFADSGSAARFFYCAKASKKDRGEGNTHPTVKPTALMRWLVRLVTPPGGTILDPFMGSGTTLLAARDEGFDCIGVDLDAQFCTIARNRLGL